MSDAKPASRRRHDAELKRQVIAACAAPGASVAQVAMNYGLNANLVHKWRRLSGHDGEPSGSPAFVPVRISVKLNAQFDNVNTNVRQRQQRTRPPKQRR